MERDCKGKKKTEEVTKEYQKSLSSRQALSVLTHKFNLLKNNIGKIPSSRREYGYISLLFHKSHPDSLIISTCGMTKQRLFIYN